MSTPRVKLTKDIYWSIGA